MRSSARESKQFFKQHFNGKLTPEMQTALKSGNPDVVRAVLAEIGKPDSLLRPCYRCGHPLHSHLSKDGPCLVNVYGFPLVADVEGYPVVSSKLDRVTIQHGCSQMPKCPCGQFADSRDGVEPFTDSQIEELIIREGSFCLVDALYHKQFEAADLSGRKAILAAYYAERLDCSGLSKWFDREWNRLGMSTYEKQGPNKSDIPARSQTPNELRALQVAKAFEEISELRPLISLEEDYEHYRDLYPHYLIFQVAKEHLSIRNSLKVIKENNRMDLAFRVVAAKWHKSPKTIAEDWKNHKPTSYRRKKQLA